MIPEFLLVINLFFFVLHPVDVIARIYATFTNSELNYIGNDYFYRRETNQHFPVNFAINFKGKNWVKSHREQAGNIV